MFLKEYLATSSSQNKRDIPMNPYEHVSLREAVWQKIDDLTFSLLSLKTQYNAIAPVSIIPPEILAYTFQFLAHSGPVNDIEWIVVSHVCRFWRQVALRTPNLWTHVPMGRRKWTNVMLARSKSAPLFIGVLPHLSASFRQVYLSELLDHIPRVENLHLHARIDVLKEIVKSMTSVAPMLRSLMLSFEGSDKRSDKRYFKFVLPEELFSGFTPRLETLHIENCALNWDSPLLCGHLTRLVICKLSPSIRPTMRHFLLMLSLNPQLKELRVDDALQSVSPSDLPGPTVTLALLQDLTITDETFRCAYLIDHLDIPDVATVQIQSFNRAWRLSLAPDVSSLIPAISRRAKAICGTSLRHVVFEHTLDAQHSSRTIRFQCWSHTSCGDGPFTFSGGPKLDVSFGYMDPFTKLDQLLQSLKQALLLTEVHSVALSIWGYNASPLNVWHEALHGTRMTLIRLRHVHLNIFTHPLQYSMLLQDDTSENNTHSSMAWPNLETVELHGMLIGEGVVDCLRFRFERGFGVKSLSINHCQGIAPGVLSEIGTLVHEVTWDGEGELERDAAALIDGQEQALDEDLFEQVEEHHAHYLEDNWYRD